MTFERDKGYSFLEEELPLQGEVSVDDLAPTNVGRPQEFTSILTNSEVKIVKLLQSAWEKGIPIEAVFDFDPYMTNADLAQGYYAWVILDGDEAIKIFKMPSSSEQTGVDVEEFFRIQLTQLEFQLAYGGKNGVLKVSRIFTDENFRVVVGFGMERIDAGENLGQYLQKGGRLTPKMIDDLISQLKNLYQDTHFSHGDIVSKVIEDKTEMYYVNTRNILVVPEADDELVLRLIDHNPGGFFNHPLESPLEEIEVLERYLHQFSH